MNSYAEISKRRLPRKKYPQPGFICPRNKIFWMPSGFHTALRFWLLSLLLINLQGCQFYQLALPPVEYYYLNPDVNLSTIGRTALVELNNDSSFPAVSVDVTEAFFQALQKKQVFGLTLIRQDTPTWRSLQPDLHSPSQFTNTHEVAELSTYTFEQLSAFRKVLKCNAMLIGTITDYKPYPHMAIGLRLKLIDLNNGRLLWALEQIWDSADKSTERRIKNYFRLQMRSGFAPLREQLVAISSLKFIKFVAYEVAETIRPRYQMN